MWRHVIWQNRIDIYGFFFGIWKGMQQEVYFYQTTRRHIPLDNSLRRQSRNNMKDDVIRVSLRRCHQQATRKKTWQTQILKNFRSLC
jgi:hypothetical protein